MPTTTLVITGMQSDDCLRTVMNAIQDLPCIGYVDVSSKPATPRSSTPHGHRRRHPLRHRRGRIPTR
jgi:hypothetical protein